MAKVKVQKGSLKVPKTMKTMSASAETKADSANRSKKSAMMQPKLKKGRY